MAKFWDALLDLFMMNSEYTEPENDTEDEDAVEEDEQPKKRTVSVRNDNTEILPETQKPTVKIKSSRSTSKVVQMRHSTTAAVSNTMGVCVIKPIDVDNDAREISDTLLSGNAVIINLEGLNVNMAQRIVDFTAGACCAINGNLKIISTHVFIATPESVDISGDFQELLDSITGSSTGSNHQNPTVISTAF